jgi:hypothetical protein
LIIDAVSDRPSGNRPNGASDQSTAKCVAAAAVVADDRASKRAEGSAGDSSLLSVGARADTSGKQGGNPQGEND